MNAILMSGDEYMKKEGNWDFLTDWTFTDPFPMTSLLKEGKRLIRHYEKKGYTRFNLTFPETQHMNIWGKKENDYEI